MSETVLALAAAEVSASTAAEIRKVASTRRVICNLLAFIGICFASVSDRLARPGPTSLLELFPGALIGDLASIRTNHESTTGRDSVQERAGAQRRAPAGSGPPQRGLPAQLRWDYRIDSKPAQMA